MSCPKGTSRSCARSTARSPATREALVRDLDPSIRVYDRPFHPDASGHEGREGFLRFSETDWEACEEVIYGRGKSSALGIEEGIVNVWKLRRGKCVELRIFSTIEEALEAMGAPE